jgi:hypothetical protein
MKYSITTECGQWTFNRRAGAFENVFAEGRHFFDSPEEVVAQLIELEERRSIHNDALIYKNLKINHFPEPVCSAPPNYIQLSNWLRTSRNPDLRNLYVNTKELSNPERVWRNAWVQQGRPKIGSLAELAASIKGEQENI